MSRSSKPSGARGNGGPAAAAPHPSAARVHQRKSASAVRRLPSRLLLALAGLLILAAIAVAIWESDWMLERQAAHANREQIRALAAQMPGSAIVQYYYARRLAEEGRTQEAIEVLQRAYADDPNSARVAALLGDQLTRQARFEEAGALLQDFVRRHPREAEGHYALGIYDFRVFARPQAAAELKEALRLAPDDVRAWRALGEAQAALGQYADAAKAYGEALARAPGDADTLLRRGNAYLLGHNLDAAEADLRAASKAAPSRLDIRFALADLLARYRATSQAQQEAEQIFQQLLAANAPIPEAQRELGRLYSAQKRWREAETELRAYTDRKPEDAEGLYLYAAALRAQHKPDGAAQARFRAAKAAEETRRNLLLRVQSEPHNLQARLEQARFLEKHGEVAFAILAYERVLHLDPGNKEAQQALARLRPRLQGGGSR